MYLDIVADPDLNGVYDPKEMLRMVKAAAACVRHSASRRPRMGLVRDLCICILIHSFGNREGNRRWCNRVLCDGVL